MISYKYYATIYYTILSCHPVIRGVSVSDPEGPRVRGSSVRGLTIVMIITTMMIMMLIMILIIMILIIVMVTIIVSCAALGSRTAVAACPALRGRWIAGLRLSGGPSCSWKLCSHVYKVTTRSSNKSTKQCCTRVHLRGWWIAGARLLRGLSPETCQNIDFLRFSVIGIGLPFCISGKSFGAPYMFEPPHPPFSHWGYLSCCCCCHCFADRPYGHFS